MDSRDKARVITGVNAYYEKCSKRISDCFADLAVIVIKLETWNVDLGDAQLRIASATKKFWSDLELAVGCYGQKRRDGAITQVSGCGLTSRPFTPTD